jgi:hypothetical protein
MPMKSAALVFLALTALAAPALAADYPVAGKWGESAGGEKGAIDCTGKRVIAFNGDQRTDSKGGVPAYRNKSVTSESSSRWRVIDEFTTGQISNATVTYSLVQLDADHIALDQQKGGTIKLQRCK